jgi:hypothetical protein
MMEGIYEYAVEMDSGFIKIGSAIDKRDTQTHR